MSRKRGGGGVERGRENADSAIQKPVYDLVHVLTVHCVHHQIQHTNQPLSFKWSVFPGHVTHASRVGTERDGGMGDADE